MHSSTLKELGSSEDAKLKTVRIGTISLDDCTKKTCNDTNTIKQWIKTKECAVFTGEKRSKVESREENPRVPSIGQRTKRIGKF